MSAVLCLPACLCVSAAASRGQAPLRERVTNQYGDILLFGERRREQKAVGDRKEM